MTTKVISFRLNFLLGKEKRFVVVCPNGGGLEQAIKSRVGQLKKDGAIFFSASRINSTGPKRGRRHNKLHLFLAKIAA